MFTVKKETNVVSLLLIISMNRDFLEIKQTLNKGKGLYAKNRIPIETIIMEIPESRFISYSLFD